VTVWPVVLRLLRLPRPRAADVFVLAAVGATLYVLLGAATSELRRLGPSVSIDLHPRALPGYAAMSLARMIMAYVLSLGVALVGGYAAARNPLLERILVPVLDVLQSIPILSFLPVVLLTMIALFPRQTLGLELASILLIFTGMVWNLAFSFYHSLLAIPEDLLEAVRMMRLSWWQRFTTLELPAAAIGLVWNSMMSWAGGWFFLMAEESFTLVNRSFTLPGLGSYLATASSRGDLRSVGYGLAALVGLIVLLDQLVWRPLVVWSRKFKIELTEEPVPQSSWFLDLLQGSRVLGWLHRQLWTPICEWIDRMMLSFGPKELKSTPMRPTTALAAVTAGAGVLIALGMVELGRILIRVPPHQWRQIATGAAATTLRVGTSLLIAAAWTVPTGVAVGLRPYLARTVQPLVQIAASIPATALFPVVLLVLVRLGGGLEVASILLMLLGSQWYVLFNTVAGAVGIPQDLREASALLRLRGWLWWRTLALPAIFPHLVTGGLTAQGGAWNASIVSEYVTFGGRTLRTLGLGALISSAAAEGDIPLLAAATVAMAGIVVVLNRTIWRRLARLAEERYHL
jgi:NitT/TauT family transport system permease protein